MGSGSWASDGGDVAVSNFGSILTTGIFSDAIFVQSIGGGGGASGGLVSIGGYGSASLFPLLTTVAPSSRRVRPLLLKH
ncbi:MAG: hypothetical protein ABSH16_03940 [Sedimentisphaerales bacterium]